MSTPARIPLDIAMRLFPAGYQRDHATTIIADAIRAAEERRDAVWADALNMAHYDAIDGLHDECVSCALLRALLSGNAPEAP